MFYAYVVISQSTGKRYIGHTDDLDRRVAEHNSHDHNPRSSPPETPVPGCSPIAKSSTRGLRP